MSKKILKQTVGIYDAAVDGLNWGLTSLRFLLLAWYALKNA